MITAIFSAVLALASLLLTIYMRKMEETAKPLFLIGVNSLCLTGIILLNTVSQINSSSESDEYKQTIHELEVLIKVNEFAIPVFQSIKDIINNYDPVQSYIYHEDAKLENPDAVKLLTKQQENIRIKPSFQRAEKALADLHQVALKLKTYEMQFGQMLPKEIVNWSNKVLKINVTNMDEYFDPYAREHGDISESVKSFMEDTGKAFGFSIGKVRLSSNKIAP